MVVFQPTHLPTLFSLQFLQIISTSLEIVWKFVQNTLTSGNYLVIWYSPQCRKICVDISTKNNRLLCVFTQNQITFPKSLWHEQLHMLSVVDLENMLFGIANIGFDMATFFYLPTLTPRSAPPSPFLAQTNTCGPPSPRTPRPGPRRPRAARGRSRRGRGRRRTRGPGTQTSIPTKVHSSRSESLCSLVDSHSIHLFTTMTENRN